MEIIVFGAGAIGSLYGAKLSARNDVTLIAREDHVRAINAAGLHIEGRESETVRVRAATKIDQIGPDALILLTTKVTATHAALAPIASLVRADTTIVALQNGLGSEGLAKNAVDGRAVVLRGITQAGAIYERPGTIKYMVPGLTLIEKHERSSRIAKTFNAVGLDCRVSADMKTEIWRKLIFNCVVNPITAMLGCEVGGIAEPKLDRLKQVVIDECLAVAKSEGVTFDLDFLREINSVYASSHNLASMHQDILRGRETEIDYLNGAVAALGRVRRMPCPANSGLTSIIKAMETRSSSA